MKVLVIGASNKPERYSYKATEQLLSHKHTVVLMSNKTGNVFGIPFTKPLQPLDDIDTVTLYISKKWQIDYYDYLIQIKPKRVIFNPGTENFELQQKLKDAGIRAEEACTLVLLSIGNF